MFKRTLLFPMLLLSALVILPVPAFAVSTVSISPAGNGVFVVRGDGLQGVGGLDLNVSYDPATMSSPSVVSGKLVTDNGMMNVSNTGVNPIRVAIIGAKAIGGSGSGTIATITFTGAGRITGLSGKLIDLAGKNIAARFTWPTDPAASTGDSQGTGTTTTDTATNATTTQQTATQGTQQTATTTQPFVVGGTLTFPPNDMAGNDRKEPATQPAQQENLERQVIQPETAALAPEAGATRPQAPAPKEVEQPAPAQKRVQSVLERFRLFQGEKTVKSLSALFNNEGGASFSQSPAIGIADGKASIKVTISKVTGDKSPNFAFNSARYVSLTRIGSDEWVVEARPEKGVVRSSLTMLSNDSFQELPFTVAPKAEVVLNKSGELTEADFQLFLKERGTESTPKFDLNGDGRRDYIDDYIFTANYLVKMEEKKANKKKTSERKPQ